MICIYRRLLEYKEIIVSRDIERRDLVRFDNCGKVGGEEERIKDSLR